MNAKKKAAATVLHTAPLPPAIDVPPTITAVRTENTKTDFHFRKAKNVRVATTPHELAKQVADD